LVYQYTQIFECTIEFVNGIHGVQVQYTKYSYFSNAELRILDFSSRVEYYPHLQYFFSLKNKKGF